MTKNIFKGGAESTLTVEKFTSFKGNTTDVWKNYGYFLQQKEISMNYLPIEVWD